jgi:hypothetical protein
VLKGNWMSCPYLFSEWSNEGMDHSEAVYGSWLQSVYTQLVATNRNLGNRACECDAWETQLPKVFNFSATTVVMKTKDGRRDITA